MSAVAIPQPKTGGARPPLVPPFTTGYDPYGDDAQEPYYRVLTISVKTLLKEIHKADPEHLGLMRKLIEQRKRLIEEELRYERMLAPEPLPPLIRGLHNLDFLGKEEEPVSVYVRLLNLLDDAAAQIDRALAAQKESSAASE